MSICLKCNKELEDGAKYCSECGTKVSHSVSCHNCKKPVHTKFAFCPYCGAAVEKEIVAEESLRERGKRLSGFDKRILKLGGSAVAIILVIVLLLPTILSSISNDNHLFYIRDKEMFYATASNLRRWQVTENFITSADLENEQLKNYASHFSNFVKLSDDGKKIFYIDRIEDTSTFSLYYRTVDNKNKEPEKLASKVKEFYISDNGDCVTYLQAGTDKLYRHNLKEREKIADEVTMFRVTNDGKKVFYIDNERNGYLKTVGGDAQNVDSGITAVEYVSNDLNMIYYLKDNALFRKKTGEDTTEIASDIQQLVKVYESGECYYLKSESVIINLQDYVEDDMQEVDATSTMPEAPQYPDISNYATQEEYEAACAEYPRAYAEYEQEKMVYSRKEERDELRGGLEGQTMEILRYKLYYYSGEKETVVADSVANYKVYADEKAAIIYSSHGDSEVPKVKFSEVEFSDDIQDYVREALYASCKYYVAVKDKKSQIKQQGIYTFDIDAKGETIYILAENEEETDGQNIYDLYKVKISGHKAGKPRKCDSGVHNNAYFVGDDCFLYYKDVDEKGECGGLYLNGKKVESDVWMNTVNYDADLETLWYMVDWEKDAKRGTLKKYDGKKVVRVSDDVHSYVTLPGGETLYLYDYDIEDYKGELYIHQKSKAKKVDDDVVVILPVLKKEE